MAITETTSQSWFGRIGGSIKGVLFGGVMFIAAIPLLFWNEGRAVQTFKTLNEGSGAVISIQAQPFESQNEGKLVHLSGRATTDEQLKDEIFNVPVTAIRLNRNVQMYQWAQDSESTSKKKVGGGKTTTTTYTYFKEWSSTLNDSSNFHEKEGHDNPGEMPFESRSWQAAQVTVGDYQLSPELISEIEGSQVLPVEAYHPDVGNLHEERGIFTSQKGAEPVIGDVRVRYSVVMPRDVSIIAQQNGHTFEPYQSEAGGTILILQEGIHSAEAMFQKAQHDNVVITWFLRVFGFFIMFFGLKMMLKVFTVLADVVPFFGSIANVGISIISLLITLALSAVTIGIAWVFYRPLLGISLLAITVGAVWWTRNKVKAAPTTPPPAPPPPA
ncbi:MAG: TMEM43 family protein [bacterium]